MDYKDKDGKVLYGFSQENLERTNKEIKKTNLYLRVLVILFGVFLALVVSFFAWLELNNVITRLIFGQ